MPNLPLNEEEEEEEEEDYLIQLAAACEILENHHLHRTEDKITLIRNTEKAVDIYVVSDPEWMRKIIELTQSEFKKEDTETLTGSVEGVN